MTVGSAHEIDPTTVVHRIGGGGVDNLSLKPKEQLLSPPGFSVLVGGTAEEAAEQMRQAFPDAIKFSQIHRLAEVVGSATVAAIRQAGFDIVLAPSEKFPNHTRIIHPEGLAGFSEANRQLLSGVFHDTPTPGG